jgi:crotonobetainyl-CoA:carnitine CoA-transferase CaiB-like acyl-CoA transferase
VIKVEAPRGDTSRTLQPMSDGVSSMVAAVNRGKRYLGLDLGQPGASTVLTPLLEWADVLVQNLRPGKATSLGIDAASGPPPTCSATSTSTASLWTSDSSQLVRHDVLER